MLIPPINLCFYERRAALRCSRACWCGTGSVSAVLERDNCSEICLISSLLCFFFYVICAAFAWTNIGKAIFIKFFQLENIHMRTIEEFNGFLFQPMLRRYCLNVWISDQQSGILGIKQNVPILFTCYTVRRFHKYCGLSVLIRVIHHLVSRAKQPMGRDYSCLFFLSTGSIFLLFTFFL